MNKYKPVISSPFRWAGSKKRLLNEMLNLFDNSKNKYIEGFLGSGVVLINLLNNKDLICFDRYIVNDSNENIISFYKFLQDNPKELIKQLKKISDEYNGQKNIIEKENLFYIKRDLFNNAKNSKTKSILFWFLMKTGFNGVYRENSKGRFNVPFGKKEKINLDDKNLLNISSLIANVEFNCLDYKDFFNKYKSFLFNGDFFVYLDPPYLPEDDAINQTHIMYSKNRFDHHKFKETISTINNNSFMISMSNSCKAREVYGEFIMESVADVVRTINPNKNINSIEVAFVNYCVIKDEIKN